MKLETFEIHITGNKDIHSFAQIFGLKTIEIGLLGPYDKKPFREEHMTSIVGKYNNLADCMLHVEHLKKCLYRADIVRTKVECPFTNTHMKYLPVAHYVEAHFDPMGIASCYPLSVNLKTNRYLATDRVSGIDNYVDFEKKWMNKELEICVYDDNRKQDADWFERWATHE